MTKRDAFEIACRVAAMYAAILAVGALAGSVFSFEVLVRFYRGESTESQASLGFLVAQWVAPAGYALLSAWLWLAAPGLANRMDATDPAGSMAFGAGELQGVLFRTVGLVLFANGLVGVASFAAFALTRPYEIQDPRTLLIGEPGFPASAAQFVLGGLLLAGWAGITRACRALANFWRAPQEK